jgi:DNA-binding NtrC family response regulator
MITAHYSTESAVVAIQKGAADYLEKPLNLQKLRQRVDELLDNAAQKLRARQVEAELAKTFSFEGIIGRSPLMLEALSKIRRVAPHYNTLLLTGATGTGKELFARALHRLSPVAKESFVVCNCAALPSELIESELFGHVKGAFTGAYADRIGLFEAANGGTLFLDEVGELPLASQAKLLRAVQHREIHRLGTVSVHKVNVRIICATNRDLRGLSETKEFREDLYFRLSMVEIQLPRLWDRKEDLPLLIRYFIEKFSSLFHKRVDGITHRAEALLGRYAWPGNVRELENIIGSACMMTDSTVLDREHLSAAVKNTHPPGKPGLDVVSLEEMQRLHARRMLEYFDGDKVRTAELLGISRATLYRLLAENPERQERAAAR